MELRLAGLPGGVTQRKIKKSAPGRIHSAHNVMRRAHAQSGKPHSFGMTGNQSHGLMTDRSTRHK